MTDSERSEVMKDIELKVWLLREKASLFDELIPLLVALIENSWVPSHFEDLALKRLILRANKLVESSI